MPSPDSTHLETSHPSPPVTYQPAQQTPLKIKIMPVLTRNRAKSDSLGPSGSEYNASEPSSVGHEMDAEAESEEQPVYTTSQRGRRVKAVVYEESDYGEDEMDGLAKQEDNQEAKNLFDDNVKVQHHRVRDGDDEDDEAQPRRRLTRRSTRNLSDFIIDDDEDKQDGFAGYSLRRRTRSSTAPKKNGNSPPKKPSREDRYKARLRRREKRDEDDQYVDNSEQSSADADGSVDENEDAMGTSDLEVTLEPEPEPEPEPEQEVDNDGKPYSLRQRQKINYAIPPPLEEMPRPPPKTNGNRNGGSRGGPGKGRRGPGWSASGAELGRWMGMGGDDSVCIPFLFVISLD